MENILIQFLGDREYSDVSFRKCIWPILFLGQMFGLMPVIGITNKSITELRFKWQSRRTIYALISVVATTSYAIWHLWNTFSFRVDFHGIGVLLKLSSFSLLFWKREYFFPVNSLFFVTSSFGYISFFALAMKWPELMRQWENVESNLTTFHNYKQKRNQMLRIRYVTFTIFFLAFGNSFSTN